MGHELESYVLEEFRESTLIYEENNFGGNLKLGFLVFWSGFPRGVVRRGDTTVFLREFIGPIELVWGG
jgi:hypothetical protein